MKIVVTGASGFLGWHTRARLHALTDHLVVAVSRANWSALPELSSDADAVIHIAGVNRAQAQHDVERENIELAEAVAAAASDARTRPRVVFANSIQSGNGTAYGSGKAAASDILATAAYLGGLSYVDVRLPNLFGEHGQPRYNSFVATFADALVSGVPIQVQDRPVPLLHAQDAAQSLIDALRYDEKLLEPPCTQSTVQTVLDRLRLYQHLYANGDIPPLETKFDVDLFNTYRAALFPGHSPIPLTAHQDDRGRLVETVRAHGGQGQTFVSTTRPGVTRGEHFHLRKVERFVVLSGRARISLRQVLTDRVVSFDVTGDDPVVVDMPTLWAHNITNTGDTELTTLFWTDTLFDPDHPDTFRESVAVTAAKVDA